MPKSKDKHGLNTRLTHMGRDPDEYFGIVNPPVARASTILYPSLAVYEGTDETQQQKHRYGNISNPMNDKFCAAVAELEAAHGSVAVATGMAAITAAMLTFLKAGDHVLVTDALYGPTRELGDDFLARFGIEVEYYDPLIGAGIESLFRPNTRVVYLESPGSGTFEVQDIPAIAAVASKRGIKTIADNAWAGGLLFRPIEHGVNLSIVPATKYIGGHADVNLGAISADTKEHYDMLKAVTVMQGACASQDDMYLALRGLRTMALRLERCAASALEIAAWLEQRPEVQQVYHPALPSHPTHDLWKRDFKGSNGLISFLLQPAPVKAVHAFVDTLELFPVGDSWGGYESLLQPQRPQRRTAVKWTREGKLLRIHVGLEDTADLIADLENGFRAFNAAR